MRNMSFSATTEAVRNRQKIVTRRVIRRKNSTWRKLQSDDHLMAIEKGQGLKLGEHPVKLGEIVVLDMELEPLIDIINKPVRKPRNVREWAALFKMCPYQQNSQENRCIHGGALLVGNCNHPFNPGHDCCPVDCPGVPETVLEGFPDLTAAEFVKMIMKLDKCDYHDTIARIAFDYWGVP